MPETQTIDEVVNSRAPAPRSANARPMHEETVDSGTGFTKASTNGVEDETHGNTGRSRKLKASTEEMIEKFDKGASDGRSPAPHEEGDADEEAEAEEGDDGAVAAVDADESDGEEADEGDGEEEGEGEEKPDPVAEWQTTAARLEARNRELISELETARKTPKAQRSDRETALLAAEHAYVEEGTVAAMRKFLGVIVGAAPDSKEVDAELAGVYTDLASVELGVPLDEHQKALRDNARTRLLLARDRREKAEADKKPAVDNSADDVQYGEAAKYVDNLLATKTQSGTSIADEYPMLMTLAQDFDGFAPSEVIARAIRQEIMTGTLDANANEIDMIRKVAPKIEKHYDAVAKKIETARAKTKKPGTTTSAKPKVAVEASKESRQSPGARTLSNAAASRAPATPPKVEKKQKAKSSAEKTRKDFKNESSWREYLLEKHGL